jgi:hypothetical protein
VSKPLMVAVMAGLSPTQIDDFPSACERSGKGALHLLPRSTVEITASELEHIRRNHPEVTAKLLELNTRTVTPSQPKESVVIKTNEALPVASSSAEERKIRRKTGAETGEEP